MMIDPYCQRRKCSAQTLLCDDIAYRKGYADIREGSLDRGHQMRVVSSKIAFLLFCSRYIFRNFKYETKIIMSEYIVPNGVSLTLKQVTLNGLE